MFFHFQQTRIGPLTLKMASVQVVETSVANSRPFQDSSHPDDNFQSRHVTAGFKPVSYLLFCRAYLKITFCLSIFSMNSSNFLILLYLAESSYGQLVSHNIGEGEAIRFRMA